MTTALAARGNLECLKYAVRNGAKWHPQATEHAARGHLSCLRFCHENGAEWTWVATHNAAMTASIDCLRYANEHGAPRHEQVVETCIRNLLDHPDSHACRETLMYAVDAGFPYRTTLSAHDFTVLDRLYGDLPDLHQEMFLRAIAAKDQELDVIVSVRNKLHQIRIIQRAWLAVLRAREMQQSRKRDAADVIQTAYLQWTCRPGCGQTYKRARASFERVQA